MVCSQGYWTVFDSAGQHVAGGEFAGQVAGSGGEFGFCIGDKCDGSIYENIPVTVHIRTESAGQSTHWNLDGAENFGGGAASPRPHF